MTNILSGKRYYVSPTVTLPVLSSGKGGLQWSLISDVKLLSYSLTFTRRKVIESEGVHNKEQGGGRNCRVNKERLKSKTGIVG